jgi:hypothetical protein
MKLRYIFPIFSLLSGPCFAQSFGGINNGGTSSGGGGSGTVTSLTSGSPNIVLSPSTITTTGSINSSSPVNAQASATSYTVLTGDMGQTITHNTSSAVAVTLPQCNTAGFLNGVGYGELNLGAGIVTITPTTSTINGAATLLLGQNQAAYIICSSGNWIALSSISPPETDGDVITGANGVWGAGSGSGGSGNLGTSAAATNPARSGQAGTGLWTNGAGLVDVASAGTNVAEFASTGLTLTAANANGLIVGPNGTTNPAVQVDTSATSAATGIDIISLAAVSGVTVQTLSSGTNEGIKIAAKGSGTATLSTSSAGTVALNFGASTPYNFLQNRVTLTSNANSTASQSHFSFTGAADTALTASTEANDINFALGQVRQHATGALALNRDFLVTGSTHSFVGASTVTDLSVLGFLLPGCGTNATCTNVSGLYHASTALTATGTISNSYPLNLAADTGATNNYVAQLAGTIKLLPSGTLPVVSSCGSGTLTTGSGDNKGSISGITSATACTITFGTPLSSAPSCVFSDSAASVIGITSISTAAVTTSMTALTGTLYYICM